MSIPERRPPSAAAAARQRVFVGRAGELAVLEAAAAAARGGETRVLIEGEAGAGKSSMLARFASGLAGVAVLRASGDEAELLLPYGVVGQLVASGRGPAGAAGGGVERPGGSAGGGCRSAGVAGPVRPGQQMVLAPQSQSIDCSRRTAVLACR